MDSNPLKVQIEYTDAKGERITVDKEVKLEMTSGNMTARGAEAADKGSGIRFIPALHRVNSACRRNICVPQAKTGSKKS